jgi:DNA repair exonuclease SbcCD ATPase subunit
VEIYTQEMKLVSVLLCLCFAARGQAPSPDPQTLQTLLAEVRQLRLAIERSNQIGPRIQIAVERLKLQQEQVARVARQLDDLRRDLDKSRSEQGKAQQRIQALDSQATQAADPVQRKGMEEASKELKLEVEQGEKSLQQLQVREGELASQLQVEQGKLAELNDHLDQVERALKLP